MYPRVAIVGRPNVGKSTLINRIVGRRTAIVEEKPGVTRDRNVLQAEWVGREFEVIDTGGFLTRGDSLTQKVSKQAERAIGDADVVILVVDATTAITKEDEQVARIVQRANKPTLVVANKVDDPGREVDIHEFVSLGLGWPIGVSALHGRGSGDMLDALVALLPEVAPTQSTPSNELAVAIAGRPNVGKSTLFNRLVGDERAIVHDEPGTTRDTIDTVIETPEGPVRFVDTAGLRRRAKIDEQTEYYSMVRTLQAVDHSDAVLFVIDSTVGVTNQDQRLAERIDAAGSFVVIVLNKIDLLDAEGRAELMKQTKRELAFVEYAPIVKISAMSGKGVQQLLPAVWAARSAYEQRVPTAALNKVIREAQAAHPAPTVGRRRPRILYATQGAANPPTFTLFATHKLPQTYLRYVERKIREDCDLGATPMKLRVRLRNK